MKVDRLKKIIQELQEIQKTRPDAKELRELIENLKVLRERTKVQPIDHPYPTDPTKALYNRGVLPYQEVQYYKKSAGSGGQVDWKKLEKLLEQIQKTPDKVDPKEVSKALEEIRKAAAGVRLWVEAQPNRNADPLRYDAVRSLLTLPPGAKGRFGIRFSPPSNDLRDHLGLPKDQGLVIEDVDAGSPAAKAGLKTKDIALKFNGQPVPSDTNKATQMFAAVKDGTSVDLTILRRGKEEVIKGIRPTSVDATQLRQWIDARQATTTTVRLPAEKIPEKGALVSILSDGGKFTAKHREKQLTITIKGTLKDGKAANLEILIEAEGKEAFKGAPATVPEAWRPRVIRLLELIRNWQSAPQSYAPDPNFRDPTPQGVRP